MRQKMGYENLNIDGYFFNNGYNVTENNRNLVTEHYFDPDDLFFEGHYPGNPIVPGVLLIKWMVGAINILIKVNLMNKTVKEYKINEIKFKRVIHPKDLATLKVALINDISSDELNFNVSIFMCDKCATIGKMSIVMK
jgi:3-hydroxymyristoyl/3-hydroxydecanoyl-(acyl carrier protein) dehydratase